MDKTAVKKQLLDFTVSTVESFLQSHKNLEFYSFAYDCNAEYAQIGLCFNTEAEFAKTLKYYRSGEYSSYYQSQKDINELKFNTGDWKYHCFATLEIFGEEELNKIFSEMPEDNYESRDGFIDGLLELFCEVLPEFAQTKTFGKIPKTEDFTLLCTDHDDDLETATSRMQRVKRASKSQI